MSWPFVILLKLEKLIHAVENTGKNVESCQYNCTNQDVS